MIHRAHNESLFNWIFVNNSRESFRGRQWIERRYDSDNSKVIFSSVADLNLMKYGDIFLGAFTGIFSKMAFYLMAGYHMRVPPFVSLDYPMSCEAADKCLEGGIEKTIEEMISNPIDGATFVRAHIRDWIGLV